VTDFSVYRHFLDSTVGDDVSAVGAIYQYYTGILHEVLDVIIFINLFNFYQIQLSKMYNAPRLGALRFKIYPTGIIISKVCY